MILSDCKILFIHGYTASSLADYYPSLSLELEKYRADFSIPDLPGGKYPQAKVWLTKLHEIIKRNTKPLIIVGHSLGTRAALLLIEKYDLKVERLFLIATFANQLENANRKNGTYSDFFMHKVDTEKIKKRATKSYVLHSKDDNSIPFEQGKEIARDIGAELIASENRNHFSDPSNAPYILSVLKEKIGF